MSRICIRCGGHSTTVDSRPKGDLIKRRRKCLDCDGRWTTYELREDYIDPIKLEIALATVMEDLDE